MSHITKFTKPVLSIRQPILFEPFIVYLFQILYFEIKSLLAIYELWTMFIIR